MFTYNGILSKMKFVTWLEVSCFHQSAIKVSVIKRLIWLERYLIKHFNVNSWLQTGVHGSTPHLTATKCLPITRTCVSLSLSLSVCVHNEIQYIFFLIPNLSVGRIMAIAHAPWPHSRFLSVQYSESKLNEIRPISGSKCEKDFIPQPPWPCDLTLFVLPDLIANFDITDESHLNGIDLHRLSCIYDRWRFTHYIGTVIKWDSFVSLPLPILIQNTQRPPLSRLFIRRRHWAPYLSVTAITSGSIPDRGRTWKSISGVLTRATSRVSPRSCHLQLPRCIRGQTKGRICLPHIKGSRIITRSW